MMYVISIPKKKLRMRNVNPICDLEVEILLFNLYSCSHNKTT